jgi:hypothetical protein
MTPLEITAIADGAVECLSGIEDMRDIITILRMMSITIKEQFAEIERLSKFKIRDTE